MEDNNTHAAIPTLKRKSRESHKKCRIEKTTRPDRRSSDAYKRRRCSKKTDTCMKNMAHAADCSEKDSEEDKDEIDRKIKALQSIVPGGESFGVDELFEETAGYIVALQYQVKTMRALTSLFERLEKEKRKFGG